MDTDAELSNYWWERVKYYAQLVIERVEYGIDAVKELLSTLTIDERCGVMLEFDPFSVSSLPINGYFWSCFNWRSQVKFSIETTVYQGFCLIYVTELYNESHLQVSRLNPI
ncbi:hypothetical protein [Nostoc sp.]